MGSSKIQVGYGSDGRGKKKKGLYAGRSTGKIVYDGGFNGQPTQSFQDIDKERWDSIFPNGFKPSWEKNA